MVLLEHRKNIRVKMLRVNAVIAIRNDIHCFHMVECSLVRSLEIGRASCRERVLFEV